MKHLSIIVSFIFFALSSATAQTAIPSDIQKQIDQAFLDSFRKKENLQSLIDEMESKYGSTSDESRYWLAYTYYQNTITEMQIGKKKLAKKSIDKAIFLLDEDKDKDSEDLALLSSAIGLSINFSPWKAPFLGMEGEGRAKEAIELDDENIRAYLAIGRSSYYKPAMFGGGDEVEEMMLKVISLPEKTTNSASQPTWGKSEAYYILADFYHEEDRDKEAYTYCMKGLKAFPNDYRLKGLKAKLAKDISNAGK